MNRSVSLLVLFWSFFNYCNFIRMKISFLKTTRATVRRIAVRSRGKRTGTGVTTRTTKRKRRTTASGSVTTLPVRHRKHFSRYYFQIFYCSRTHSQLSQFVKEIQKSPFSDSVRLVSLASRNIMCINDAVKRLGSNALINERCLEMQKSGKKKQKNDEDIVEEKTKRMKKGEGEKCPFYRQTAIEKLRDQALLRVLDIEELAGHGRRLNACPYYASRHAATDAQIIVLPYNTLLHKPTREAVGLRLKGSVVVVDEAHNLLDTVTHIHSSELSGKQICAAHSQLGQYMERYRPRLKAKNLLYIKQILFILRNMIKLFGCKVTNGPDEKVPTGVRGTNNLLSLLSFMTETKIDNLDLNKLVKYMTKSNIARKLHGFAEKYSGQGDSAEAAKLPEKGIKAFLKSIENNKGNKSAVPNDGKQVRF
jgi:chromosome transmission fidelity protein 1